MTITIAFTLTGLVALVIHLVYLRRVILNRNAQIAAAKYTPSADGDRLRIAQAFVGMESFRFLINLCFLTAGTALLLGFRPLGYLLALPPLLSVIASTFALRGIR